MPIRAGLALIALLAPGPVAAEMDYLGTTPWGLNAANGVSGLELTADGERFQAVSDRGWYLAGDIDRTDGRITGITVTDIIALRGHDGWPVTARRAGDWADAEGLGVLPDGTIFVSFERWAHVSRYTDPAGIADLTRDHPTFYDYRDNRQLEAVAITPEGEVLTVPERPVSGSDTVPVYRLAGKDWEVIGAIEVLDRFAPVGADYGPDGKLYLLERKLTFGLRWQSRIRRFTAPEGAGEVLWTSRPGQHDNLEGIALWQDAGGLRITMVSDNNGDVSEPTAFVEYRLTE